MVKVRIVKSLVSSVLFFLFVSILFFSFLFFFFFFFARNFVFVFEGRNVLSFFLSFVSLHLLCDLPLKSNENFFGARKRNKKNSEKKFCFLGKGSIWKGTPQGSQDRGQD